MPKQKQSSKKAQQQQIKHQQKQQKHQQKKTFRQKSQAKGKKGTRNLNEFKIGYQIHFDEFQEQTNKLGLMIRDVEGDGNCLFRSIADVLTGNEKNHRQFRRLAVEVLESKRDFFSLFIEDDMTFDQYLREMSKDSEWGGHLELQALASEIGINFIIHMKGRPAMVLTSMEDEKSMQDQLLKKESIHLAYHLVEHVAEHYSAVRMLGDDSAQKAEKIPITIFEGIMDQLRNYEIQDVDIGEQAEGFEGEDEEMEWMREEMEQLRIKEEEQKALEQLNLKQSKNSKCNCGSKKTYKDCCLKKLLNQQQQPQQQFQQQGQEAQQQQSVVFI